MVFKLQISLDLNEVLEKEPEKYMLLYNQDKSIFHEAVATPQVLDLMNNRNKIYVEGDIVNNKIQITKEVAKQNW